MRDATATDTIKGELISFEPKTPDGWGVGSVRAADGAEVRITGKLVAVQCGEGLELAGTWADTDYGRQFRVTRCTTTTPVTLAGTVTWLSANLPEVGERRALAMVERFGLGDRLWAALEKYPEQLTNIDGITIERARAISAAYGDCAASRAARIQLHGWGLTDGQIERCVERWHTLADVIAAVRGNPYELSEAVQGFGFKRADAVALRAGVPYDSPLRVGYALHHVLGDVIAARGHTYMTSGELRARTVKLLGVPAELVADALEREVRRGRLVRRAQRIYTEDLDGAEGSAAVGVQELLRLQHTGGRRHARQ